MYYTMVSTIRKRMFGFSRVLESTVIHTKGTTHDSITSPTHRFHAKASHTCRLKGMASTCSSLRLSMGEGEGEGEQENEGENDDIHLTCATSRPLVSPDEAGLGLRSRTETIRS